MRVGVFHPGTQHSWQTAIAFQETDQLAWYATSIFYNAEKYPYKFAKHLPGDLSKKFKKELRRRYAPNLRKQHVRQCGVWEWLETGARRGGRYGLAAWCDGRGNTSFHKPVINLLQKEPVDVLWGFNNSALETFRWAKNRGIMCVLDQTIGHPSVYNKVMDEELAKHPEFFLSSYRLLDQKHIDRQNEELELADMVVVGSPFCAKTLVENSCAEHKLRILPYGFDETIFPSRQARSEPIGKRPIRFLFAGKVDPRKGVAYLLNVFGKIPTELATLTVAGPLSIPEATFKRFSHKMQYVGEVPRNEMISIYENADCFVFPSLFEGSAIVLAEALGAGLCILQSERSGDGAVDNRNGIVLPEVSEEALWNSVHHVINNTDSLVAMQRESWAMRCDRTWSRYRARARALIQNA